MRRNLLSFSAALTGSGLTGTREGGGPGSPESFFRLALTMFLPGLMFLPTPWVWLAWAAMLLAFALTVVTGVDYLREAAKLRATYLAAHPEEGRR